MARFSIERLKELARPLTPEEKEMIDAKREENLQKAREWMKKHHLSRVKHIATGRTFFAEYSREAAEWYDYTDGTAYDLAEVEIVPL